MAEKTYCIRVTGQTKKRLDEIGKKNDSYEDIIKGLLHIKGYSDNPPN